VGDRFGSGDGSTTFRVPDLRGRFVRGVDGGTGRDPNAAARTAMNAGGATGDQTGSIQAASNPVTSPTTQGHFTTFSANLENPTAQTVVIAISSTSAETRPLNAALPFIIKF
jgi:microcystin-dependent protein